MSKIQTIFFVIKIESGVSYICIGYSLSACYLVHRYHAFLIMTDADILEFCEEAGFSNVVITRKEQSNGSNRKKTVAYISFTCTCERNGQKKWSELKKIPSCKLCLVATKPKIDEADIKAKVESLGHEYICIHRIRNGKTRIMVTFICKCSIATSRKESISDWSVITKNGSCQDCGNMARKETNIKTRESCGDEIQNKIRSTMIERFGASSPAHCPELVAKKKATNLARYGFENAAQSPEIVARIETTMEERYGARHYMQNSEMREKWQRNAFKTKQYKFPSGRIVDCQGYEHWAYELLLLWNVPEEDILVESNIAARPDIPKFWYEVDGVSHRYYPDICIWSERKIIEVKSEYTASVNPEILALKKQSIIKNNFKYEMWVFEKDGTPNIIT